MKTNAQGKLLSVSFEDLPFDDFVFDLDGSGFGMSMQIDDRHPVNKVRLVHYWFRITKAEVYLRNYKKLSPWFKPENFGAPTKGDEVKPDVFLEVWLEDPYMENKIMGEAGLVPTNPEITAIQLDPFRYQHNFSTDDMLMFNRITSTESKKILEEYRNHLVMAAILCYHVRSTQEYMVEVRPEVVHPRKHGPKDKKPWTYEYLPRIIMIDPNKAAPYLPDMEIMGEEVREATGTHASPRPHQRRGHYRKYKSERFRYMKGKTIFVKPSWVGPEEWVKEGQMYRVLRIDGR